jgi:uncharacterized protein (TIGR02677 family)
MSDEPRVFAHLDAPLSAVYRRVLAVFVGNKERFVVHLRPEDVAQAVRLGGDAATSDDGVESALRALADWGNLRATPDTGRVTTVQDFYRSRYLYQLSREGEAAERALAMYESELGRRGELQTVALADVRTRVRALLELATADDGPLTADPAIVHNLLLELAARLDSLAANASAFMSSLQRTIDLHDVDEEAFLVYKDRLIGYLERFVGELVSQSFDIAESLRSFPPGRLDGLLALAAEREASDAVPDGGPPAPGGAGSHADGPDGGGFAAVRRRRLDEWARRWTGIESWFVGSRHHPSQAELLRQRARRAIPDLLTTVGLLQERRAGRSDRSADFRELARWFAQTPTEDDAHRLWRAAFGLSTARHLTGAVPAPDLPAQTPWAQAPPVEIAARLRATGRYTRRGPGGRVVDRSADRARLASLLASELAEVEAARARLATGTMRRLSELDTLDPHEFRLFLSLLGEALSAGPPGPDGLIRTTTGDGSTDIVLVPLPGAPAARVETADGVVIGPDHEITITSTRAAVAIA